MVRAKGSERARRAIATLTEGEAMSISQLRRTAAAAAVIGGSFTFFGGPAGAQVCYPPTPSCVTTSSSGVTRGPDLELSATTVERGQTITATVTGFDPGTSGIITIASVEQQIGSFTMPASGAGSSSITIPTNISLGGHTVFARGTVNGQPGAASEGITVVAEDGGGGSSGTTGTESSSGSGFARTGIFVIPTALVGAGLVLGGMALKRSSRRGKTGSPT